MSVNWEKQNIENAEHYGYSEQSLILNEELSELIQAISKYRRNNSKKNFDNVVEEIADVEVMLHDEFGFGHDRLNRFKERFNFKAECIGDSFTDWQDQIEILREECGLEYSIRFNDKNVRV